jgi:hypothetical protein
VTRECNGIVLSGNNITDDAHAGLAGDVADDSIQFDVHQLHVLLHLLNEACVGAQKRLAVPKICAKRNEVGARPKAGAQQAIRVQLLQPLAVQHVALSSWDIVGMVRIHRAHLQPAFLEDLVRWYPVDPGCLHRNRLNAAGLEPVCEVMQAVGQRRERADVLTVAIDRHRYPMLGAADVNPCGVCF